MHICVYLFYFYYYIFCYIPLKGAKTKKAVLPASEAKLPKQQVIESPGLFCPGSLYPLSSTPFSLGIKGSALSVKNHTPKEATHSSYHPLIFQCESIRGSVFPESLLGELWLMGGGGGVSGILGYLGQPLKTNVSNL